MNAENIVQRTSVEIAPIPSESFKNLPKLSTKEFRATVETGAGTATFDVQCTKKEYLKSGRIETSFLADISAEDGNIMLSGQMVSGTTDNTTERFTVNEEFQVANSGHDGKLCLATTGTFFHMVPRSLTPNLLADDIRNTLKEVVTSGMESREVMSETEMFSKKNVIFRAMEDISESF